MSSARKLTRWALLTALVVANLFVAGTFALDAQVSTQNHCGDVGYSCYCQDTGGGTHWCDDWVPGQDCTSNDECEGEQ